MPAVKLIINEIIKQSNELNYLDICILYKQFIETYKHVPTTAELNKKHNMPQARIINKILKSNGITYNDFLNQFGKVSHVRTEDVSRYDEYVKRFVEISKNTKTLLKKDLFNNSYGLPSGSWFVKYCPDKSVKTYSDFICWCGLKPTKKIWNKEEVADILYKFEKEKGSPIIRDDITLENLGFSEIVITRLFGSLNKCKKELGLKKTLPNQPVSFEIYKDKLDRALENIRKIKRDYITWKDIEQYDIEHKSITKAFKREGIDIFAYIKSKGFLMNPSNYSFHYTFDDGERVLSSFEYDLSAYLKETGYVYNKDYFKDYMYSKIIPIKNRTTCDYYISGLVIEIAGVIDTDIDNWKIKKFSSKQENNYRDSLIKKIDLLEENNIPYLLLFPSDFVNNLYKNKVDEYFRQNRKKIA